MGSFNEATSNYIQAQERVQGAALISTFQDAIDSTCEISARSKLSSAPTVNQMPESPPTPVANAAKATTFSAFGADGSKHANSGWARLPQVNPGTDGSRVLGAFR